MSPTTDESLLRAHHAARERGDARAAAEAWEALAVRSFDRIAQLVRSFRFAGTGAARIPDHEHGSAVSESFMRVLAMGASFESREPAAFHAALRTCVHNACHDFGRRELRHAVRAAGSLDERRPGSDEAGPYEHALAAHATDLERRSREAVEVELERIEAEQLVAWAIAQIANDGHRAVLDLTYRERLSGDEIAARLGISADNVYQRRRRGGRELERILRDLR